MMVWTVLVSFVFATRINASASPNCRRMIGEGDIAINGDYIVAAVFDMHSENFPTVSIYVSPDRGNTWRRVKTVAGTLDDGWVVDSRCKVVDPSVTFIGDRPSGFVMLAMARCPADIQDSSMIIVCRNESDPLDSTLWQCYNYHRYNPAHRDKPWVIGIPGSSRIVATWMKDWRVYVLTNDSRGDPASWNLRFSSSDDTTVFASISYLTYHPMSPYNVYLAYEEAKAPDTVRIKVYRSADYGSTWDSMPNPVAALKIETYRWCPSPYSNFPKTLMGITPIGYNGVALAYVGDYRGPWVPPDTPCNVRVSISEDGGGSWTDTFAFPSPIHNQLIPSIASQGDTLHVFYLEGNDSGWVRINYSYWDRWLRYWRNSRSIITPYHPDSTMLCPIKVLDYTSLITLNDTAYYYWGGDIAEDGIIYSGGGNGWFLRGLLSEITGVSERGRLVASELYEVFGRMVELKVDGEIYDPSGRLRHVGRGRVSLPAGVYFVRMGRRTFKVIVR